MKTTELFVEQLVIGVATLVTGLLLFDPLMIADLRNAEFGQVVLATTAAYLLGIVADRVADTLLERVERIHRLSIGLRAWWRAEDALQPQAPDPFPEDALRARLWSAAPAVTEYATYHRSRMRLTRALTVLAPAAGAALVALRIESVTDPRLAALADEAALEVARAEATLVRGIVVAAYLLAFVLAIWPRPPFGANGIMALLFGTELPRTDALVDATTRQRFERFLGRTTTGANDAHGTKHRAPARPMPLTLLIHDPATQLAVLLLAMVTWRGFIAGAGRPVALLALGTAGVTALFGWTWWRVTRTFFDLLEELGKRPEPA